MLQTDGETRSEWHVAVPNLLFRRQLTHVVQTVSQFQYYSNVIRLHV